MNHRRTIRLLFSLISLFALTVTFSFIVYPQVKQYKVRRFQSSGQVQESVTQNLDQAIKLKPTEKLVVVQTGDTIKQIKSMVPLQPNVVAKRSVALPEIYYAKVEGTGTQIELSPIINTDAPMKYSSSSGLFEGKVLVFLQEKDNDQSKKLTQSIDFSVVSEADNVSPSSAAIDHSSYPPAIINLSSQSPSDSVHFTFITSSHPQGYKASIQVSPHLTVHTADTVLQGFGLERTTLEFLVRPPLMGELHPIQVSASLGSLDSDHLNLEHSQASMGLRSGFLGKSRVTVKSPEYGDTEMYVTYVFPFRFLIAMLIGGIVGGIIRMRKLKHGLAFSLVVGVLWGITVAVAWAGVGLNLLNLPLPVFMNECVVFVLSVLAAMWGPGKPAKA